MTALTTEQQDFLVAFFNAKADAWADNGDDSDAADAKQAADAIAADATIKNVCDVFSVFDMEADLLEEIAEVDERNDIVEQLVA